MGQVLEKRFPLDAKEYKLYEEVGEGVSASVYRALCIPLNEIVAIKVLDQEKCNNDLARNILINSNGAVKLADFGVSACKFDSGDRQRSRNTFVGTPCWYIYVNILKPYICVLTFKILLPLLIHLRH
ncbi:putative non-specific serine/threonine protein kinase [Rosa chinensis]|uniref:Putative non-specific serine/threonine protein kinase n=1 Tax=Rosa chinensis TaxID=74649 RepID=A0A2P6PH49_ROSCH|nr:putative non-specific serine/threonine protein kinase [Rosa chinensis]